MFYIKWGKKKIDFLRTDLFILKKCIEKTEQCDIINQVSDISVETFRMCWFWNTVMCRLQVFLICWSHYWPCQLSKRRQGMGLKNCHYNIHGMWFLTLHNISSVQNSQLTKYRQAGLSDKTWYLWSVLQPAVVWICLEVPEEL